MMSSDSRFRPPEGARRRQRPIDDETARGNRPSSERRDPRRRTSFVPRQGSGRSFQQPANSGDFNEIDDRDEPRRVRPSQRRSPRRPQALPHSGYDHPDDREDQVILETRGYAAPADRRSARRPSDTASHHSRTERHPQDDYSDDSSQAAAYTERYDDSFIDEDDWYEEEAAAGATTPRRRVTSRGGALKMPRRSVSRPNIPKPVIPARIKEAALVGDNRSLAMLGLLFVSIVAMALVTMNRTDELAPGFATHISASGLAESIRSETALWQLPLMAAALLLMNVVAAWFFAAHSAFSARFLLATSLLVQLLIWVALIRIAF